MGGAHRVGLGEAVTHHCESDLPRAKNGGLRLRLTPYEISQRGHCQYTHALVNYRSERRYDCDMVGKPGNGEIVAGDNNTLTDEDRRSEHDLLRTGFEGTSRKENKRNTIRSKEIFVVDGIIKRNRFDRKQPSTASGAWSWYRRRSGPEARTSWLVVEDQFGLSPALHLHGRSLKLNALHDVFQKRIANRRRRY